MRISRALLLVVLLPAASSAPASPAPAPRFLESAVLTASVDDAAELWVNGIPLASIPYTPQDKGQAVVELGDLCAFRRDNLLAVRVTDTNPTEVGFAYVLRMEFSDKSRVLLTSNEEVEHRSLWVGDRGSPEPAGWLQGTFADSTWGRAFNVGVYLPNASLVHDEEADVRARFLSASGDTTKVRRTGERHLFRRAFTLDLTDAPGCITPSPTPSSTPTGTPRPSWSPTPTPALTKTWTPFRTFSPTSTHTVLVHKRKPYPTWTPTRARVPSRPTRTPVSIARKAFHTWTFTPTIRLFDTQVVWKDAPRMTAAAPSPTRTFTPAAAQRAILALKVDETLTFERPPFAFYALIAEKGLHRIEVFDASGRSIRVLFAERVNVRREAWIDWDGKDANGGRVGAGKYTILYFRDGNPVRKISAVIRNE